MAFNKLEQGTQRRIPVYAWMGILIFTLTVVSYFDRLNISLAAPLLAKKYGWSAATMGMVFTMFGVGYILTQIPGGIIADKIGGRRVILLGTIGWGLFSLLTPLAVAPLAMYLVRAALGATEGVYFPAATSVIARWIPLRSRARFQGLNMSGISLGPLIATPLMAWMISTYSWQSAFWFSGILTLIWAVFWFLFSKDDPAKHPSVTQAELEEIQRGRDQISKEKTQVFESKVRTKAVWFLGLAYGLQTYVGWMFLSWLPTYLISARGFSIIKMGIFGTLPNLAMFLSMYLSGWISDNLAKRGHTGDSRRPIIYVGLVCMSVFIWLTSQASNGYMAILFLTITYTFYGLNFPPFWSLPADISVSEAGVISGIMNTFSAGSAILAPLLTGILVSSFGWSTAIYTAAFTALLAIIFLLLSTPKKGSASKASGVST